MSDPRDHRQVIINRRLARAFFRAETKVAEAHAAAFGDLSPALAVAVHVTACAAEVMPGLPHWIRQILHDELKLWSSRRNR